MNFKYKLLDTWNKELIGETDEWEQAVSIRDKATVNYKKGSMAKSFANRRVIITRHII